VDENPFGPARLGITPRVVVPATYADPLLSIASAVPSARLAKRSFDPSGLSSLTKLLEPPTWKGALKGKSLDPVVPVTHTLPAGSSASPLPESKHEPPR